MKQCPSCDGSGDAIEGKDGPDDEDCPQCNGGGIVEKGFIAPIDHAWALLKNFPDDWQSIRNPNIIADYTYDNFDSVCDACKSLGQEESCTGPEWSHDGYRDGVHDNGVDEPTVMSFCHHAREQALEEQNVKYNHPEGFSDTWVEEMNSLDPEHEMYYG